MHGFTIAAGRLGFLLARSGGAKSEIKEMIVRLIKSPRTVGGANRACKMLSVDDSSAHVTIISRICECKRTR
jgi:hypothetical protein